MVLEVHPATRTVMVHRPNVSAVSLTGDDELEIGDVLPGFSLPLREIFDRSSLKIECPLAGKQRKFGTPSGIR